MNKAIVLLLCSTMVGCTWSGSKNNDSQVVVKLPEKIQSALRSMNTSDSSWGLSASTALNSIDCYALYSYAADLEQGSCVSTDGASTISVSRLYGLFKAGSTANISLPSGTARTIGVFAFNSSDGSCDQAMAADFNPQKYSVPLAAASVTQDLQAGNNSVTLQLSSANAKAIKSCKSSSIAGSTWPQCQVTVKNIAYTQQGTINISGSCLSGVSSVAIVDQSDSTKTSLSVSDITSDKIVASLSSSFTNKAGHAYSLVVNTAFGAVATVPFSIERSMLRLQGDGVVIGEIADGAWSGYGGYGTPNVLSASGQFLSYSSTGYNYTSTQTVYLNTSLFMNPPSLSQLTPHQILSHGMIGMITQIGYTPYFSDANCSGDVYFNLSGNSTTLPSMNNNILAIPQNCANDSVTGIFSCSSYAYKRVGNPILIDPTTTVVNYSSHVNSWAQSGVPSTCMSDVVNSTPTPITAYPGQVWIKFQASDMTDLEAESAGGPKRSYSTYQIVP